MGVFVARGVASVAVADGVAVASGVGVAEGVSAAERVNSASTVEAAAVIIAFASGVGSALLAPPQAVNVNVAIVRTTQTIFTERNIQSPPESIPTEY
jgi:hypothetical protein